MADEPPIPIAPVMPASEPFPGSRTPGWNDPPTLQYNPLVATSSSTRTRLNLNKRIAFPLQGTTGDATASKPTAVVLPNQNQTSLGRGQPPPVAVVYPMQSTNMNSPPLRIRLPTPTAIETSGRGNGNGETIEGRRNNSNSSTTATAMIVPPAISNEEGESGAAANVGGAYPSAVHHI